MRVRELLRVAELLGDVLGQRLLDLLGANAVGVDRVGDVAHHRLDLHPVGLLEQVDDLLARLGVLLGQDVLGADGRLCCCSHFGSSFHLQSCFAPGVFGAFGADSR